MAAALLASLVVFIPICLEVRFALSDLQADFAFRFVVGGVIKWRVNVPLVWLTDEGVGVRAKVKVAPGGQKAQVADVLTSESLAKMGKTDESLLHRALAGIDVVQMLFESERKNERALGGPWFHLITMPFKALGPYLNCVRFDWQTRIGLGDAASTALVVGVIWSLKPSIISLLRQRLAFSTQPHLNVTPNFSKSELATELVCIFRLTVGQIMWRTLCDAAQRWQRKGVETYGG